MIGLPRDLRHLPASRSGLLKGLGTDAAQMGVAASVSPHDYEEGDIDYFLKVNILGIRAQYNTKQ